jgi:hypothetical protein
MRLFRVWLAKTGCAGAIVMLLTSAKEFAYRINLLTQFAYEKQIAELLTRFAFENHNLLCQQKIC